MRIERRFRSRKVIYPMVDVLMTILMGALIVWVLMSSIVQHMSHIGAPRTTIVTKESATHDNNPIHPSRF